MHDTSADLSIAIRVQQVSAANSDLQFSALSIDEKRSDQVTSNDRPRAAAR
jgi:hypothetical protein